MDERFARHDLVSIAPYVRRGLDVDVVGAPGFWPHEEVLRLAHDQFEGAHVPGIVARQPEGVDGLVIGLASPYRASGMRLRAFATVNAHDVVAQRSPFQVAAAWETSAVPDLAVFATLERVLQIGAAAGLACGIYGSCALALVTGLPYCHEASDADVVVQLANKDVLAAFLDEMLALEDASGVSIDVEVLLPGGWGIKLKELFDSGSTVLAKGFRDVRLLSKGEVFVMDHRFSFERKEKENGSQVESTRQDGRN